MILTVTKDEGWKQLLAPVGSNTEFMMQMQSPHCFVKFEFAPATPSASVMDGCIFSQSSLPPPFSMIVPSGEGLFVRNFSEFEAKIWYR